MSRIVIWEVRLSEEEFSILKALAERWFNELIATEIEIEETLPELMKETMLEEIHESMETSKRICAELGVSLNELGVSLE